MKTKIYRLKARALAALLAILSILAAFSLVGCDEEEEPAYTIPSDAPVLEWRSDGLFAFLPPPITEYGRVIRNTDTVIELEYYVTDKSQFAQYVQLCVSNGYNQSMKNSEFFYSASDEKGYKFSAQYKDGQKTVTVTLDAGAVKETASLGSAELAGRPYAEVVDILKGFGFANVALKVLPVEDDSEHEDYTVESVTVDSKPLEKDALISRSATVAVRYYKRNVSLSLSAAEMHGSHYTVIDALLSSAGFVNIIHKEELAPANSGLNPTADNAVISVSINGREDFKAGDTFSPNAIVTVTHMSMDIVLNAASESYRYKDPDEVAEELRNMGFRTVTFKPTHDFTGIDLNTCDGTVSSISIKGNKGFAAGDRYSRFSPVEIEFYQYNITIGASANDFKTSMFAYEAEEYLKELGFVNVTTQKDPQGALITGWVHFEDEIYKFLVNGKISNFVDTTKIPYDAEIVITYYYRN